MLQYLTDQIKSVVLDITPCRQCTAMDALQLADTLSIRSRNIDQDTTLNDIIDIAYEMEISSDKDDDDLDNIFEEEEEEYDHYEYNENGHPSNNISALLNSKTCELIMNISHEFTPISSLPQTRSTSHSMPFITKPKTPPPPSINTDIGPYFPPNFTKSKSFHLSPRNSRAFSVNDGHFNGQRPYIISASQSETSSPIDNETETTESVHSMQTVMRAPKFAKPNVYSPMAKELWNEEDIDDLHSEMSQQFVKLTKRLSVESIHSFHAQRRTFNQKSLSMNNMHLNEDEDEYDHQQKEFNEQMIHLAQLHNDAIECKFSVLGPD